MKTWTCPHLSLYLNDEEVFIEETAEERGHFSEVPDELYPYFVEKVWEEYQTLRLRKYRPGAMNLE